MLGQKLLEAIFGDQAVRRWRPRPGRPARPRATSAAPRERDAFTASSTPRATRARPGATLGAARGRREGGPVSPLRKGRAKVAVATRDRRSRPRRSSGARRGRRPAGRRRVAAARQIIAKVGERSALGGDHTVVALAGATGSGKSSLFNALAGLELAQIGARRPTTVDTDGGGVGRRPRRAAARLARGPASARASAPSVRRPTSRPGHSTASCCSTCPTSTPGSCRTGGRPSASSRSATCSSG